MNNPDNIKKPLSTISKENPFTAPEGYFDGFAERLGQKMKEGQKLKEHPVKYSLSLKHYAAAAILLIVALLGGYGLIRNNSHTATSNLLHQEISQAVEQDLYSINEETIIEVMETAQGETGDISAPANEEAIEYLLNEGMNEHDLINAL
jgi:hypothetical protein